jgi:hypothetical protein
VLTRYSAGCRPVHGSLSLHAAVEGHGSFMFDGAVFPYDSISSNDAVLRRGSIPLLDVVGRDGSLHRYGAICISGWRSFALMPSYKLARSPTI